MGKIELCKSIDFVYRHIPLDTGTVNDIDIKLFDYFVWNYGTTINLYKNKGYHIFVYVCVCVCCWLNGRKCREQVHTDAHKWTYESDWKMIAEAKDRPVNTSWIAL